MSGQKYFDTELDRQALAVQRLQAELERVAEQSRKCATAVAVAAGVKKQIGSAMHTAEELLTTVTDNETFAERLRNFVSVGKDLDVTLTEVSAAMAQLEDLRSDRNATQDVARLTELRGIVESLSGRLGSLSATAASRADDLEERLNLENRSAEYQRETRVRRQLMGLSAELSTRLQPASHPLLTCVESQSRELLSEIETLSASSHPTENQLESCRNRLGALISKAEENERKRMEREMTAKLIEQAFEDAGFASESRATSSDATIRQNFEKNQSDMFSRVNTEVETGPNGRPVVWANMQSMSGGGEVCFVPEEHGTGNLAEIVKAAERLGLKIRPFYPNDDGTFEAIRLPQSTQTEQSKTAQNEADNSRAVDEP